MLQAVDHHGTLALQHCPPMRSRRYILTSLLPLMALSSLLVHGTSADPISLISLWPYRLHSFDCSVTACQAAASVTTRRGILPASLICPRDAGLLLSREAIGKQRSQRRSGRALQEAIISSQPPAPAADGSARSRPYLTESKLEQLTAQHKPYSTFTCTGAAEDLN